MEKPTAKFFLILFLLSFCVWLGAATVRTTSGGKLIQFGTIEFKHNIELSVERSLYNTIAEYSIITMAMYPLVICSAAGYLATTRRTFRQHGWLLMSALLLFIFVPVEVYGMYLDWKLIGLNYWGDWPIEEFRKAFLVRLTAFSGLPFIATLSYYTIIILVVWQPMKKKPEPIL